MNDILCPTDLTATAEAGIAYAEKIALRLGGSITLLHALTRHEKRTDASDVVHEELDAQGHAVTRVRVNAQVQEGEFIHVIEQESRKDHVMMVCATHGSRGLRQSLFGPDILKLVRKVAIPSVVVQKHTPRTADLGTIVMPVAGHDRIHALLDAVCLLAGKFGSTVHIYQLLRPGEQPSEALEHNKRVMMDRLGAAGIPHLLVEEPSHGFSVGFAQPTIDYAKKTGAGCIAIMSVASEEYRYIADAEKERLLTNEPGIPVLCAH